MKRFGVLLAVLFMFVLPALAQDWIRTGTGVGGEKIRIAVPDFKLVQRRSAVGAARQDLQ